MPSQFENSDEDEEIKNADKLQGEDVGENAVAGSVAQLQISKFANKRPPTGSQE